MRTGLLNATLRQLAEAQRWCVSENTLRIYLPEPENTFRVAMSRHARSGLLQRVAPGLYLNPYAPRPSWALERLAARLRPDDFFYVSLESALHEYGAISQMPSRLTLMTSGRSHTYETPLGVIEFVHTKRPPRVWRPRAVFDAQRSVHVANEGLAREDLQHVRRNLDLLDDPTEE